MRVKHRDVSQVLLPCLSCGRIVTFTLSSVTFPAIHKVPIS